MFTIGNTVCDRYEVLAPLGEGSTATVYKALDTHLKRTVALKVLLPHVRDSTRERFFQEATSAAQLNHPNIMTIYDIDKTNIDQPFLVVEYVDGDLLTEYIPTSAEQVVTFGVQIAQALDYAHEREIIHRDIKPANIKVTPDKQVKIMDLGLALPRAGKRVTATGMVIGTPAYLSPEQAQGHSLDRRTDIYSLGIVLYEMITGQLPFDADDIAALLLQQVRQAPPPPRLLQPDIPIGLETVILRALEKKPDRRFQSCRTFADALRESIRMGTTATDETLPHRPEGLLQHVKRTIRLVLADDHNILRKTLASFLEGTPEFVVVAEAADGEAALRQTLSLLPDVLLLDLNMPIKGGLDILPVIREKAPSVKVLVLTGREENGYIVRALRAGANGYILKSAEEQELIDAIKSVMEGNLVLGHGVAEKVVTGMLNPSINARDLNDLERQVLVYVAAGYHSEEIVDSVGLPLTSVIEAIASAMNKLNAQDRNAAAIQALRRGDILLEDIQHLQQHRR